MPRAQLIPGLRGWHKPQNYLFEDKLTSPLGVGSVNGTLAEPGPGPRTVNDVETTIKILDGKLRGGGQPTSAVWGECRLVYPSFARAQGRALSMIMLPQDYFSSYWWIGLATSATPGTPDTAGGGIYQSATAKVLLTSPAGIITFNDINIAMQPFEMLLTIIEQSTGFYILASAPGNYTNFTTTGTRHPGVFGDIPTYPLARIWWVDRQDTTDPLYPVISFYNRSVNYPNNHAVDDVRLADLPAPWNTLNGIAYLSDSFTGADGTPLAAHVPEIGGAWAVSGGTWNITSNKILRSDGAANYHSVIQVPSSPNYLVQCRVDCPAYAGASPVWGIVLKYQDLNNLVSIRYNGSQMSLSKKVAGVLSDIATSGYVWTQGTQIEVRCYVEGDKFLIWRDRNIIFDIQTDAAFQANAGVGFWTYGNGTQPIFDDLLVIPMEVTLPGKLLNSKVLAFTPGDTLASDTFTGGAGDLDAHVPDVGPAWVEIAGSGNWVIDGAGKANIAAGTVGAILQDLGVTEAEVSVDITLPVDVDHVVAGIINYIDATHYLTAWLIRDVVTQPDFHEIEVRHYFAGYSDVAHKVGLGDFIAPSETHTLKVQFTAEMIRIYLDGNFCNSYISPVAMGTKFGLVIDNYNGADNGSQFDNWIVRAL